MKKILFALAFATFAFAAETQPVVPATESTVNEVAPQATDIVAITEAPSQTDSAKATAAIDVIAANQATHDSEIALRDSLLAAKDSINAADKQAMQTKLDVQEARCENWEKSYSTLETDFQTCSRMLRTSIETQEQKDKQLKETAKMNAMAQSTSFIGGVLIGLLIGWLVWD